MDQNIPEMAEGQAIDSGLVQIFDQAAALKASDILLTVGVPPVVRVDGRIMALSQLQPLTADKINTMIASSMQEFQRQRFETEREIDYSYSHNQHRFRVNAFHQRRLPAVSFRLISSQIPTFVQLGLPPIIERFTLANQGLVIITGPTGHGKSTTLASMVEHINQTKSAHIITVEDPIEYLFEHKRSVISQREVGSDTLSFARALRSSLREDPNVMLIGEMRDLETVSAALTVAETGHLVLTTLHTNSAALTPDRIIDIFPPHQQIQVRQQLANVLVGIAAQRLVPKPHGGRILATEIMVANDAIKNMIREGKTHQLQNAIVTGAADGMILLDKVLAEMVSKGEIAIDEAIAWANDSKAMKEMMY